MVQIILAWLLSALTFLFQLVFPSRTIQIYFDHVIDEIRPVHGVGRMPEYVVDSEINKVFTEANIPYCRTHDINITDIHNIFPDFSKDVDDESAYRFEGSDKVLASIVATGMKPFFRLGISYSDAKRDHELLLPPADYTKWAQICEHIILHYNEGWANGYHYNIEYWEIWNEPDGGKFEQISETEFETENVFWHGTPEEFFRLYDVAANYLKGRFPSLKFGGYGSCGFYGLTKSNVLNTGAPAYNQYFVKFFQDFMDYVQEHKPPMDFFTWHSYTTTQRNERYIQFVRDNLVAHGYSDTEIICDEWNFNPTENDKIDRRYGANQTSMLLMFQNNGLDMAHFYGAHYNPDAIHAGMFIRGPKPSTAYYGFLAFGEMYKLGSQVEIKSRLPKDLYAVAAKGEDSAALLISNISEKRDRPLRLDIGEYSVDKCMTVNENLEWVEIPLPEKIVSGSMLYITFKK